MAYGNNQHIILAFSLISGKIVQRVNKLKQKKECGIRVWIT